MAQPTSCAATKRKIVTLPVSGSISTSQNWVEKPGACPPALTEAAAVSGPPVKAFLAAISFSDNGGKSPTLLEAGLAWPSSQTTPSTSTSQIIAARARNSSTIFLLASTTAMPVAKVTREPPVGLVKPTEEVSATSERTWL